MRVFVNKALPIPPSDGVVARRIVRHGMADVLRWMGREVGPEPHALTHYLYADGDLHVSQAAYEAVRESAGAYE